MTFEEKSLLEMIIWSVFSRAFKVAGSLFHADKNKEQSTKKTNSSFFYLSSTSVHSSIHPSLHLSVPPSEAPQRLTQASQRLTQISQGQAQPSQSQPLRGPGMDVRTDVQIPLFYRT